MDQYGDVTSDGRPLPDQTISILLTGRYLARDWRQHRCAEGRTREEALALLRSAPDSWRFVA